MGAVELQRQGVILKSRREIDLMRTAGGVVHAVLKRMDELVKPGVSTAELNTVAEEIIEKAGGTALFKGVENPQARFPFPAVLCTSVNQELVHGIPNDRPLVEGDIVGIDCGVRVSGYCGDSARTFSVGAVSDEVSNLLKVTREALATAIDAMKPGRMWSEVAKAIQSQVESQGMSVVRDFVGHGIGREMHEEPKVPNFWDKNQERCDFELVKGMVLAVEPMVNLGGHDVAYGDADKWVVVTRDGRPSAHFEHTLAVVAGGAEILTDGQ